MSKPVEGPHIPVQPRRVLGTGEMKYLKAGDQYLVERFSHCSYTFRFKNPLLCELRESQDEDKEQFPWESVFLGFEHLDTTLEEFPYNKQSHPYRTASTGIGETPQESREILESNLCHFFLSWLDTTETDLDFLQMTWWLCHNVKEINFNLESGMRAGLTGRQMIPVSYISDLPEIWNYFDRLIKDTKTSREVKSWARDQAGKLMEIGFRSFLKTPDAHVSLLDLP